MLFVNLTYYVLHTAFGPTPAGNTFLKNVAELSVEEKACYDKIVNDLLYGCSKRLERMAGSEIKGLDNRAYVITFRQSETWDGIQKEFDVLDTKIFNNPSVVQWAEEWTALINKMKNEQHIFCSKMEQLKTTKEILSKEDLSTADSIFYTQQFELIQLKMVEHQEEIKKNLLIAKEKIIEDSNNSELIKHEACRNIIKFLNKNWLPLCVFCDAPDEVSMNDKKLIAEVRHADKSSIKTHLINSSVRAIFTIEELELEEKPLSDEGVNSGKAVRPIKVGLKETLYANQLPSISRSSSSSSVQVTTEVVVNFDYNFVGESEKEQEKKVTALAGKLEKIVKLSLIKVNKKLSDLNDREDDVLSEGVNRFFVLFKPLFWNNPGRQQEKNSSNNPKNIS